MLGAPAEQHGESRRKWLLSCWQPDSGCVRPSGLGRHNGQGRAVWGHYLQAGEQGCVSVGVSVSGWMGVSSFTLETTLGWAQQRVHSGMSSRQKGSGHMEVQVKAVWLHLGGSKGLGVSVQVGLSEVYG